MSSALAIASVTAVLRDLLNNGLIDHNLASSVGDVEVSALPPDRIETGDSAEKSQLNLFLYQVTPNQGWRNVALPSRDARGDRLTNPPLALDLHYMLTAYGAKAFHCEILLGYGMQLLHETPVLAREAIRRALAPPFPVNGDGLPAGLQALSASELAEQIEQIKITPLALTTEEISRLWTAFQAKYRPTAAYQVSVVLIESKRSTRSALPVRARTVNVVTFQQPVIARVLSQAADGAPIVADQPILAGQNLVLEGQSLRGEETLVNIGGIEVVPDDSKIEDSRILFKIPTALQAGVQGAQVIHRVLMGSPPQPHAGVSSNIAALVLRPQIVSTVVSAPGVLTIGIAPPVGTAQRVVLMLNEFNPPPDRLARAYSFTAEPRPLLSPPGPSDSVSIAFADVEAGTYLVRVQVDGAESPVTADGSGLYTAPQVTLP
jgi:hypothetical protein